jgi:hypothetical protein
MAENGTTAGYFFRSDRQNGFRRYENSKNITHRLSLTSHVSVWMR